jgi:hypothetical protein
MWHMYRGSQICPRCSQVCVGICWQFGFISIPIAMFPHRPLWSRGDLIATHYRKRARGLKNLEAPAMEMRDTAVIATWFSSTLISSLAISSDGTRLFYGSGSCIACIRDVRAGAFVAGLFTGVPDIETVAFSPKPTALPLPRRNMLISGMWRVESSSRDHS